MSEHDGAVQPDPNPRFEDFGFSFDMGLEDDGWPDEEGMFGQEGALSVDSGFFNLDADGGSEFLPPDPDRIPVIQTAMKQNTEEYRQRPAEERTSELFGYMRPQRVVLLGILQAAREAVPNAQIVQAIDGLRAHKFSVYSPANLCTMLEQAGALERLDEAGNPYMRVEPKPQIVVIDGIEYYKPSDPPEIYWKTTQAGLGELEANDPRGRLERMLAHDKDMQPIYKSVLKMTCAENGAAMTALSGAVDNLPQIAKPRRYFVQHFVENLERCEAVAWNGSAWIATDLGRDALETMLADVEDAPVTAVNPDGTLVNPKARDGRLVTETQGINW